MIKLINGDMLKEHEQIEGGSVDLILTDPPYGFMNGFNGIDWDVAIEPKKVFEIANRLLRPNGRLILFSQEPYTSALITSAIPNLPFNYRLIWEKDNFGNALSVNKAPVSLCEDVSIFTKNSPKHDFSGEHPLRGYFKSVYDFVGLKKKNINKALGHRKAEHSFYINSTQFSLCTEETYNELIKVFKIDKMSDFKDYQELWAINEKFRTILISEMTEKNPSIFNLWEGNKYKSNILKYKKDYSGYHPTQKPILLLEDLIKTYSNDGDLVVDLTMGSGSTGVAAKNTGRRFFGIELDKKYFNIAKSRIEKERG